MDIVINKIKNIQNKQQTLQWGYYKMSDNEIMFAVGSKVYPKEPHFFIISSDYTIFLLDDSHNKYLHNQYIDRDGAVNGVIGLLKEWFPAKQL